MASLAHLAVRSRSKPKSIWFRCSSVRSPRRLLRRALALRRNELVIAQLLKPLLMLPMVRGNCSRLGVTLAFRMVSAMPIYYLRAIVLQRVSLMQASRN